MKSFGWGVISTGTTHEVFHSRGIFPSFRIWIVERDRLEQGGLSVGCGRWVNVVGVVGCVCNMKAVEREREVRMGQ